MATACPSALLLQQLVASELSGAEQDDLIAHIDDCPGCQQRLEVVAGGGSQLNQVALAVGQASHAREASLLRLLADLKTDPNVTQIHRPRQTTQWMQSVLQPAASVEMLGKLEAYDVVETLGQGGMGVVLKGYDPALRRPVAIKVLAPHLAGDPLSRKRFAREAQATAAVRHPNVIAIHAVSEANGLPFLVMEFVDGGSLQEYLNQHGPLDWRTTIQIGQQVAVGLAAAHAQGLVHRDIKPSNILLQTRPGDGGATNGEPHSPFPIPKISDFGLARIADDVRLTQTGIVAGTPMYMAPEQALGGPVDGRTDLFSLGSLLYTLCTGAEPFPALTPMAVLHRVCETEPQPIAEVNPAIPVWLIGVIERLHIKNPDDRLSGAAEVAELFRAYLAHLEQPDLISEPRLTATLKRVPKSGRRRWLVGGAVLALASALVITEATGWTRIGKAVLPGPQSEKVVQAAAQLQATLRGNRGPIWSIDFSPDGHTIATGGDDGTIRLWDRQGHQLGNLAEQGHSVFAVHFGPSGDLLVSGDADGKVKLWNVSERRMTAQFREQGSGARCFAISPDMETVAVGGLDKDVELWNVASKELVRNLPGHNSTVTAIVYSPDRQILASADRGGHITLWSLADGKKLRAFRADPLQARCLAFSPDGKTLASAGTGDSTVKLWRVETGEVLGALPSPKGGIGTLAFAPQGTILAAGNRYGAIEFWDAAERQPIGTFQTHQGSIRSIVFSPDGQTLATAGEDRLAKLWDVSAVKP